MAFDRSQVIQKLREAFAMDCSIREACLYADISVQTLYNWYEEEKGLKDELEQLRDKPFLKARKTIIDDLDKTETAKWYLERKKKAEFAPRSELTGAEGRELGFVVLPELNGQDEDNLEASSGTADPVAD